MIIHAHQSKQKPTRKYMGMLKRNSLHSKWHYTDLQPQQTRQPAAPQARDTIRAIQMCRQNKVGGNSTVLIESKRA